MKAVVVVVVVVGRRRDGLGEYSFQERRGPPLESGLTGAGSPVTGLGNLALLYRKVLHVLVVIVVCFVREVRDGGVDVLVETVRVTLDLGHLGVGDHRAETDGNDA